MLACQLTAPLGVLSTSLTQQTMLALSLNNNRNKGNKQNHFPLCPDSLLLYVYAYNYAV